VNPLEKDYPELFELLLDRIGSYHLRQRILRETDSVLDPFRKRELEEVLPVKSVLKFLLRATGITSRGVRNSVDFYTAVNRVPLRALPPAFNGVRLLHLTDLHLDGTPAFTDALCARLRSLQYDYCVITGDFAAGFGDSPGLRKSLTEVLNEIRGEKYGILGNHDSIHMVPWMERLGLRMLLNESVILRRQGEAINLAGVDDYHRFRLSNLERALVQCQTGLTILLNHSPEQYRQAAYSGVDLYLCGHTHGGQICLPNGFAPRLNIECNRLVGRAAWRFKTMQGYTSRGVGTSLVRARFNCPPELVIHELVSTADGN
jgi:uncharacterized protein